MITPRLSGESLLADIAAARSEPERLHIWWLGQSGFLIQWAGRHLLFDPYLSDSLTRKYEATDKPHVRMSERVIDPSQLDFIDVVTSSHNHTDHLDADTLRPLMQANPALRVVVPAANLTFAADRLSVAEDQLIGIAEGVPLSLESFTLEAIPAAHESVDRDDQGRCLYIGLLVRCGAWSLYHSGDTMLYEGLAERLSEARVDVGFLPINGRAPERRVAGNLWGREAAELAHATGMRVVIPCHYDMFEFNTATPVEFVDTAERLGQPHRVLELGERYSL